MTHKDIEEILKDQSISYWLKDTFQYLVNNRDLVDAARDVELLGEMLNAELRNEITLETIRRGNLKGRP